MAPEPPEQARTRSRSSSRTIRVGKTSALHAFSTSPYRGTAGLDATKRPLRFRGKDQRRNSWSIQ
jgi:hypothetical protein